MPPSWGRPLVVCDVAFVSEGAEGAVEGFLADRPGGRPVNEGVFGEWRLARPAEARAEAVLRSSAVLWWRARGRYSSAPQVSRHTSPRNACREKSRQVVCVRGGISPA